MARNRRAKMKNWQTVNETITEIYMQTILSSYLKRNIHSWYLTWMEISWK